MSAVKVTITKRYGQKISRDWQSWEFMTEATKEVEISSKEDLLRESINLFKTVKILTKQDIELVMPEIQPGKLPTEQVK